MRTWGMRRCCALPLTDGRTEISHGFYLKLSVMNYQGIGNLGINMNNELLNARYNRYLRENTENPNYEHPVRIKCPICGEDAIRYSDRPGDFSHIDDKPGCE